MKKFILLVSAFLFCLSAVGCAARIPSNNQDEDIEQMDMQFYLNNCKFATLEDAFESNLLTKNDIMHISYYISGSVYEILPEASDKTDLNCAQKKDFLPQKPLDILSKSIENDIKSAYYYQFNSIFGENDKIEDLKIKFYGEYNGIFAVTVDNKNWSYGASVLTISVGGIIWEQNAPELKIFCYNNQTTVCV